MSADDFTAYLAENPRMLGVLFTIGLLLSQAGNASAAVVIGSMGP